MTATGTSASEPLEVATRTLTWHLWLPLARHVGAPVPGSALSGSQTAEFHPHTGLRRHVPHDGLRGLLGDRPAAPPWDAPIVSSWHAKLCPEGDTHIQAVAAWIDPLGRFHLQQTSSR